MATFTSLLARHPARMNNGIEPLSHRLWHAITTRIGHWHRNRTTRRQLTRLSESALRDIGIKRYEAMREAQKPFWRN